MLEAYPPSRDAGAEIRLLNWRQQLLAAECCPQRHSLVISDFWVDQSLAYAAAWLPLDEAQRVERHCSDLEHLLVRPKLLVLVDVPEAISLDVIENRGQAIEQNWDYEHLALLRAKLLELAIRPGVGPMILVEGGDEERRLAQVLAAIESMR
jgi:thymidylate kinase